MEEQYLKLESFQLVVGKGEFLGGIAKNVLHWGVENELLNEHLELLPRC